MGNSLQGQMTSMKVQRAKSLIPDANGNKILCALHKVLSHMKLTRKIHPHSINMNNCNIGRVHARDRARF